MTWIKEQDAAQLLLVHPITLRRKSKKAVWKIAHTKAGRYGYQYSKADIEKLLSANSNKVK